MRNMNFRVLAAGGALVAMLVGGKAEAQSFDGQWTASIQVNGVACTFSLVMDSGRYSEQLRCGPYMTLQSGTYVFQNGVLARTVYDWEPKQHMVVEGRPLGYDYTCPAGAPRTADGHCPRWYGGPGGNYALGPGQHYEPSAKPPGGTWRVTFLSPDAMNWYDMNFHGNLTYYRAR